MGAYENPDNWSTMNNSTATFSLFTATKAIPGNPGSSYLKLTSKTIGNTVVNGIAVCGKLDTITVKPKSGFAYNQRPATFAGKWQHMIYGSSQGGLSVLLTKWNGTKLKRDTIASGLTTLSGMAMSWANFSFNIAYLDSFNYPDSCIIVLKASGTAPTNNDYLWVDGLAFTGSVAVLPPPPPPNLVGLNKPSNNISNVQMYPNPASKALSISYDLLQKENMHILICDMQGKMLKEIVSNSETLGSNKMVIETDHLAKGVYTIHLKGRSTFYSSKLIIE